MYRVTAADGSRVVVRVEQGGVFGTTGAEESAVMRGLFQAGYPVARILIDDPAGEAIGRPLFVMEHLDGADAPGADERAVDEPTVEAFVDALSLLHRLDGSTLRLPHRAGNARRGNPAAGRTVAGRVSIGGRLTEPAASKRRPRG